MDGTSTAAVEMTAAPRFKGQPIELGGTTYIVPPLALGAVKELFPRIQKIQDIGGIPSADDIDTLVEVVLAALHRNYPAMTQSEVLELLDVRNIRPLFRMIMGASGVEVPAMSNP